jgi:hypothetical protein
VLIGVVELVDNSISVGVCENAWAERSCEGQHSGKKETGEKTAKQSYHDVA